eukprot:scaffold7368_cov144-Skeletonema_menzelii.AAC.6
MPKLHHISKRFLKDQGYRKCLANGQRIQGQETTDLVQGVNNTATSHGKSNNHPRGGGSLLNGMKKEKSTIKKRENGAKRRRSDEVEASAAVETNQINVESNHNRSSTSTSTAALAPAAAAAASLNLQIRKQKIIWVRIGKTDHAAHEMYNPDNPDDDHDNPGSTVWVKYTSNGQVECVSRSQIQIRLQDRKRRSPTYFH